MLSFSAPHDSKAPDTGTTPTEFITLQSGDKIAYYDSNTPGKTIVMLHGNSACKEVFSKQIAALKGGVSRRFTQLETSSAFSYLVLLAPFSYLVLLPHGLAYHRVFLELGMVEKVSY